MRHGWPIRIGDSPVLLPIETALDPADVPADAPAAVPAGVPAGGAHSCLLLISAARAHAFKLANQRAAAEAFGASPDDLPGADPVLIGAAPRFDLATARALVDPALDLAHPLRGPLRAEPLSWAPAARQALALARIAGILPAYMIDPEPAEEAVVIAPEDLAAWSDPAHLVIAARARLPLAHDQGAGVIAFRSPHDMREHVALVIGEQTRERAPLVRLHSECLTGDIFGSLKCDCGPQLDGALAAMSAEAASGGWGILLYLRQEGRGIGLINKLRAYQLQDQGFDTLEANRRLGLPEEARDFPLAARMLALLGVQSIRLLTNNPQKVAALEASGVAVIARVGHQIAANPHNARYLATKRDRAGHLLD